MTTAKPIQKKPVPRSAAHARRISEQHLTTQETDMAKKKKVVRRRKPPSNEPAQTQQQFEGEGFPKKPPRAVAKARDNYVQAMRDSAKAAKIKASCHERLIEVMHEHDINRVPLDGENKFFEIEEKEKIQTKTFPKTERERRSQTEAA